MPPFALLKKPARATGVERPSTGMSGGSEFAVRLATGGRAGSAVSGTR